MKNIFLRASFLALALYAGCSGQLHAASPDASASSSSKEKIPPPVPPRTGKAAKKTTPPVLPSTGEAAKKTTPPVPPRTGKAAKNTPPASIHASNIEASSMWTKEKGSGFRGRVNSRYDDAIDKVLEIEGLEGEEKEFVDQERKLLKKYFNRDLTLDQLVEEKSYFEKGKVLSDISKVRRLAEHGKIQEASDSAFFSKKHKEAKFSDPEDNKTIEERESEFKTSINELGAFEEAHPEMIFVEKAEQWMGKAHDEITKRRQSELAKNSARYRKETAIKAAEYADKIADICIDFKKTMKQKDFKKFKEKVDHFTRIMMLK